ncbi:MAG: YgaP family membrane protein [Crocinitomicaceae bacterium]
MKRNMGLADRIIRLVIAAVLVVLFFTDMVTGTIGILFLVAAAVLAMTAFVRFCGLYVPFGINTCKVKES